MYSDNKQVPKNEEKMKFPSHLVLMGVFASTTTIVISVINIVLSTMAIVYKEKCDQRLIEEVKPSAFLLTTLYRLYIQSDTCVWGDGVEMDVMSSRTVFIFAVITLVFAILCLIAGIAVLIIVLEITSKQALNIVVSIYIVSWLCALVNDVVTGTYFGIDYVGLSTAMNAANPSRDLKHEFDLARHSALLLMMVALKGFFLHLFNIVFSILLVVFTVQFQVADKKEEHSIHTLGALSAYGGQSNPSYIDSERISPYNLRDNTSTAPMSDNYSNRNLDRSTSWRHQQGVPSSRPFSYLEEKRAPAARPPADPWHRDWPPQPPVPAPDYSPTPSQRRLKSALKSNYV